MLSLPRGTKDLFGEELFKIQELVTKLKQISHLYNYQEIETPTFEYSDIFIHNNEQLLSDQRELFFLENKKYILKPENTASIVRSIITNKFLQTEVSPIQFFYFSKCFRYERPQSGRYREFLQFGFEKINATSIFHDLEMILMIEEILKSLNLKLKLKLNFLSNSENKEKWNQQLSIYFEKHIDKLSATSQNRIFKNPLRILDDKIDSKLDLMENVPKINNFLNEKEKQDIQIIKEYLKNLNIDFMWDEKLVRGINYYTGLVYEWEYENLTIIGGGRYDELFYKFNNKIIPSLGCAIGIERLISVLEKNNYLWQQKTNKKIYVCSMIDVPDTNILNLISLIRENNLIITCNWDKKILKDHFLYSEKIQANYLIIYGENEQKKQEIIFKKQKSKDSIILSLKNTNHLIFELKKNIYLD